MQWVLWRFPEVPNLWCCVRSSNGAFPLHGTARYGSVRFTFGGVSTGYCTWYQILFYGAFPLHGTARFGTAQFGSVCISTAV